MNYVMSDIHGDYDRYMQMLQKIHFREADTLYILGDVIDRGAQGMKILQDMMMRPNVIPILGNHEYMASLCMSWLLQEVTEESVNHMDADMLQGLTEWMNVGGEASITEFHKLTTEEREDIIEYLSEFALYDVVEAGGKTFVLVHAGLCNFSPDRDLDDYDLSEMLFHVPDYDRIYFEDKYLVTGHTPTRIAYAAEKGMLLEEIAPSEYQDRIFMKNHHIAIDCGCGFDGQLACLCLETMEEYYI
ncbi:MAG: metallophosphoesterase [Lachnospiraceae bacterium]